MHGLNGGDQGVSTRARAALSDMTNKGGARAGVAGKAVRRARLHALCAVAQKQHLCACALCLQAVPAPRAPSAA